MTPEENSRRDVAAERIKEAQRKFRLARAEYRRSVTKARNLGMTYREIAEAMNTSVGNAYQFANHNKRYKKESASPPPAAPVAVEEGSRSQEDLR